VFQSWHRGALPALPVRVVDLGVLREQSSAVLAEVWLTTRALQRLLLVVADAIEDGLLLELRSGFADIRRAVELMEQVTVQIEQAMPVLEATAPALGLMNGSIAQLNATVAQLEGIPGVRMARRLVSRPAGVAEQPS
jgi:hypothetical protein